MGYGEWVWLTASGVVSCLQQGNEDPAEEPIWMEDISFTQG